jgi:hypothetical protein
LKDFEIINNKIVKIVKFALQGQLVASSERETRKK